LTRALSTLAAFVAILVGLLVLAVVLIWTTPIGMPIFDRISRPIIENAVENALQSDIRYAELEGDFPGTLVLRDFEMRAEDETWLRFEQLTVEWRPMALLGGEIKIDTVTLEDGALLAMPPEGDDQPQDTESSGLPSIPDIRVDSLVIDGFTVSEQVAGVETTFSAAGSVRYREPRARIDLRAWTAERRDEIAIAGTVGTDEVDMTVDVRGDPNGLLASLVDADGPVGFYGHAEGPYDSLRATVTGEAGRYGALRGTLSGSARDARDMTADVVYRPGSFMPGNAREALGDEVVLDADISYAEDTVSADIRRFAGAFGDIEGTLSAGLGEETNASANLTGSLEASALAPYGAEALAGPVSLSAVVAERNEGYDLEGRLDAGQLRLRVREARSTHEVPFAGEVTAQVSGLDLGPGNLQPLLSRGAAATAAIRYNAEGEVIVRNLSASVGNTSGPYVTVGGRASYGTGAGEIDAAVTVRANPAAVALYAEDVEASGALTIDATVRGTPERLSIRADADIPAGQFGGEPFPAGVATADLSGLPAAPTGSVTLRSEGGVYSGEARIATNGDILEVPAFSLSAGPIEAEGEAAVNLKNLAGDLRLNADLGRNSQILTGQTVGGSIDLSASAEADGGPVSVELDGRRLRLDGNEVGTLSLDAEGPRNAIGIRLSGTDITAGPIFLASLSSAAELNLEESRVSVSEMIARLVPEDRQVSLAAPTTIAWDDGITVDETRLDYLGESTLTFSADIGDERWQAALSGDGVPIPQSDAAADFTFDLDTEAAVPASLDLTANAEAGDDDYAFTLEGRWTGSDLNAQSRITRNGSEEIGRLRASIPLALVKSPSLGIEYTGDGLDARLQYDDRIESIYAFLPLESQPLSGEVEVDVAVTGRPDTPQTDGRVKINGARFEDSTVGLALTDLDGDILFAITDDGSRGTIDITGSGAAGREDSVRLSGSVDARGDESEIDLNLVLDEAQVARSADLELRTSADLDLRGSFQELTLSGPINIDELDIQIPDLGGGDDLPTFAPVNVVRVDGPERDPVEEIDTPSGGPVTINLDMSVVADDRIFVRGRGLNSEWAADLTVRGTAENPLIGGSVNLREGQLDLAGRTFDLTRGVIGFREREEIVPEVNIQAQTEAGTAPNTVTAIVTVSGTAENPQIDFSSSPPLPEEDILALVLFGRPANQLGAGEALQLAQAAATVSGTFGSGGGVVGSVRSSLGLDQLSFDPSARSLTVGKYIADDIYVSARQSIGQLGTALSVIYEVSSFFTVEATQKANGAQSLSANYKRDY
jgi:translocation and assembly module TamB